MNVCNLILFCSRTCSKDLYLYFVGRDKTTCVLHHRHHVLDEHCNVMVKLSYELSSVSLSICPSCMYCGLALDRTRKLFARVNSQVCKI